METFLFAFGLSIAFMALAKIIWYPFQKYLDEWSWKNEIED